jgi:hypothetical protein
MGIIVNRLIYKLVFIFFILILGCHDVPVKGIQEEPNLKPPTRPAKEDPILGPQSQQSLGEQRVLVVAVRFPDVQPRLSPQQIRRRAVEALDRYVREQSYGATWINADFRGWADLPDPISAYRISPIIKEIRHQKTRIRKLVKDTMTAVEKEVVFSSYQHILIIPGATSRQYGAPCYNANPALLRSNRKYATLKSKDGQAFSGGIFVGALNAHIGMYAHDFFHSLGGLHKGRVLVP